VSLSIPYLLQHLSFQGEGKDIKKEGLCPSWTDDIFLQGKENSLDLIFTPYSDARLLNIFSGYVIVLLI